MHQKIPYVLGSVKKVCIFKIGSCSSTHIQLRDSSILKVLLIKIEGWNLVCILLIRNGGDEISKFSLLHSKNTKILLELSWVIECKNWVILLGLPLVQILCVVSFLLWLATSISHLLTQGTASTPSKDREEKLIQIHTTSC